MSGSASNWPVLKQYDENHQHRVAMPLGGIGTGTVSLGGRGDLRDWEVGNRPAKGFVPEPAFFALYVKQGGADPIALALEGPLDLSLYEGAMGARANNHGLPRFRDCTFEAAYPLGQVKLSDPLVPVSVHLQAFNPLVPGDAVRSGVPTAILRYHLTNTSSSAVQVSVCGSVQNFIGLQSANSAYTGRNTFRTGEGADLPSGIYMELPGADTKAESWGNMALAVVGEGEISYRLAWPKLNWGGGLLDFWEDFRSDGRLENPAPLGAQDPVASLALSLTIPPAATRSVTFVLSWYFPNRMTWTPAQNSASCDEHCDCAAEVDPSDLIGNYYATLYSDAWDVIKRTTSDLDRLEQDTITFVEAFCNSDLPEVVKEAALFNLSTLRSQTCFRDTAGYLHGWEGCHDQEGCCHGSCTHVWNYEQATAYLFGDLARGMRGVEFLHATNDAGLMSFRVDLPLDRAQNWRLAAADGQMGCLMKLYRDWQLSGDDALLTQLWPKARAALAFCWCPGGWDADRDGVMEGCQHNTMDVEYYGPNPQMQSWYLGALRAAEEMAEYLGDGEFAAICLELFERGSRWTDENLFNSQYYEHQILPPASAEAIAPGLRHEAMGARDLERPDLQLGPGCLIDQLVGQFMAHVCGLGYLLDPEHIRKTLGTLMVENFKPSLTNHFNFMRSFALGDEAGMVMATYPRGRQAERPFPYANEVMTGFEYTAAIHMLYENMEEDGLRLLSATRTRYDGRKRNPFDEAECGHHYARAMASWAAVLAHSGFGYSGVTKTMTMKASSRPSLQFWSNGSAWGTCAQVLEGNEVAVEIKVLHGTLSLQTVVLTGWGREIFGTAQRLGTDKPFLLSVARQATS